MLSNIANKELLETYESERRRIGKEVTDWAFFTWQHRGILGATIGLHDGSAEANEARVMALFDNTVLARARLATINNVIASQKIEFSAHELDIGFYYVVGALLADDQRPPEDPTHQLYTPTTSPGYRLPHVWLKDSGQNQVSTHDLVGTTGDFLLVADEASETVARDAVTEAQEKGLPLRTVTIGSNFTSKAYTDPESRWAEVKDVSEGGLVLVRPDNVIAWRSMDRCAAANVVNALEVVLRRKQLTNGHCVNGR